MLHTQDTPTRVREEKITKNNIIYTKNRIKLDSSCLTRGLSTQKNKYSSHLLNLICFLPMAYVFLSK